MVEFGTWIVLLWCNSILWIILYCNSRTCTSANYVNPVILYCLFNYAEFDISLGLSLLCELELSLVWTCFVIYIPTLNLGITLLKWKICHWYWHGILGMTFALLLCISCSWRIDISMVLIFVWYWCWYGFVKIGGFLVHALSKVDHQLIDSVSDYLN